MNFDLLRQAQVIFLVSAVIAVGISAVLTRVYTFLHFLLIMESLVLVVCLLLALGSSLRDTKDGETLVLFIIAITAAESAVGVSLYLRTIFLPPCEQRSNTQSFQRRRTARAMRRAVRRLSF